MARATAFPEIKVTRVYPEVIDEWYGVNVDFDWVKPFDARAFREAVRDEERAWFAAHPREMHVGTFPLEKAIGQHIASRVVASPQWAEFYSKPRSVRAEEYEDGPTRIVTIPRFGERDFDSWDFNERGGYASASTR
jgi:hypothetical protein